MTKNPYSPGDVVSIERGTGRLTGIVIQTILARCHILIDNRVFVEDYHYCWRA